MQLRTFLAALAIGLSLACVAGFACAQQIYKWKDAHGVTHFSQTPPPKGTHYATVHLTGEPDVSPNPPAPAADGRNKPQPNARASARAAVSGATQLDTPANRSALCKQLSSNIALLQSKQPVATGDGSGKQMVLSDNAREQQLAAARAQQARYCSSKGA